jgi:leucyl aminopeptidase
MLIHKIERVNYSGHLVFLTDKLCRLPEQVFSDEEKTYIVECVARKETQIEINRYKQHLYVVILDREKPEYKLHEEARKAASKLFSALNSLKTDKVEVCDVFDSKSVLLAFAEGLALTAYQFLKYFGDADEKINSLNRAGLYASDLNTSDVDELNHLVAAIYKARDLINEPFAGLNAVQLAAEIEQMGREAGFTTSVFDKNKIESLGMGGLLAVNSGSVYPPTFSVLEWKPQNACNAKPLVMVGKGIVYDSGGLSLKPTQDSMDYMKSDMSGAAAVAATFQAIAKCKLPVWVVGLIPATDNWINGKPYAPGDVVRMHDGTTVEVLNTDAEGRMILADALSYAKQYNPALVINIATLTGSAAAAIGSLGIVAMGNASDEQFTALKESGNAVYERLVEFPFWDEYDEQIKSDIADIKNVGGKYAGSITAGKFLGHFTAYPFIHLDIAGVAFNKSADAYRVKGGTGVGIRLFFNFIKNWKA